MLWVALGKTKSEVTAIESVQRTYLRWLLRLSERPIVHFLYSSVGMMPVEYHRLALAVRYVAYVVKRSEKRIARAVLRDSLMLSRMQWESWFHELRYLCTALEASGVRLVLGGRYELGRHRIDE
jgi:hypothetical protein